MRIEAGSYVWHKKRPEWGFGIVLEVAGDKVTVIFEKGGKRKMISIKGAGDDLEEVHEGEVDPKSPIRDESRYKDIERAKKSAASLDKMIKEFLEHFPGGFKDQEFPKEEREYKIEGINKAKALLIPSKIRGLLEEGKYSEVHELAYKVLTKTNLVFPFEKSAFKNCPEFSHEKIARKLLALIEAKGEELPERIEELAVVLKPQGAAKWPILSFLALLQDPATRVFVKPTAVSLVAQALSFDLEYESIPNAKTYRRVQILYEEVRKALVKANLAPRDAIDIQTFLWFGSGMARANIEKYQKAPE